MQNIDDEIDRALAVAREYERESDAAFAAGKMLDGWKFHRWMCLAMTHAEDLARRDANRFLRCAAH